MSYLTIDTLGFEPKPHPSLGVLLPLHHVSFSYLQLREREGCNKINKYPHFNGVEPRLTDFFSIGFYCLTF